MRAIRAPELGDPRSHSGESGAGASRERRGIVYYGQRAPVGLLAGMAESALVHGWLVNDRVAELIQAATIG